MSRVSIAAVDDGKVRPEDTHLPGEADHLVVPGSHTFIMNRDEVCDAVLVFLKRGRFREPTTENHPQCRGLRMPHGVEQKPWRKTC